MENIIQISGKVKFPITLDPGVWIFDDRKIDLNTYFQLKSEEKPDELTEYKKAISKQWDREIVEGAVVPPTLSSERVFEKEKLLNGSFAISLKPFLTNAEPLDDASALVIEMNNHEVEVALDEAYQLLLGFSMEGKPLKDDGPIHVYYGDGSNQHQPLKNVKRLIVK
ncbi:peptidyl-prolyl cis-trans isomerase [Neobacillus sp. LXY-4]|uniref:peptidyl-prolyl cis-trans isomerase n=1 Tax=Neobacillus sp. LXY-4 TaxID=3379826 RepID=UPI003EE296C9